MEDFELKQDISQSKKYIITAVNSTVMYLLAYLFVNIYYQVITINRAYSFSIDAKLLYYKIGWLKGPDSLLWTHESVKHIFAIGPILSFALAIVFIVIYIFARQKKGLFKLFCVWTIMHSLNMFLGALLIGILTTINFPYTNQILKTISDFMFFTKDVSYSSLGFGYVSDWMYMNNKTKAALFIISGLLSLIIGFFSPRFFLKTAQSKSLVKNKISRQSTILFQTYLPWLFASLFLLLIKIPHNLRYEIYLYLSMLIIIFPSVFNVLRNPKSYRTIMIVKEPKPISIHKPLLIFTIILYIAFRLIFNNGIYVNFISL